MPVIDTYTIFGAWPAGGADLSLERLKAALDGREVTGAIAHTTDSVFETTAETLRSSYHQVKSAGGLSPAAVINPVSMARPWEYADAIAKQPWACVRFFPSLHRWPISRYTPFDKCLEAIKPSGIPVSVAINEPGQITALSRVALTREMTIILVHIPTECVSEMEAVLPLMENWLVSTDGLTHLGLLEEMVNVVGVDRILFGSATPRGSIEGALRYVRQSHVPEAAKEAILLTNAQRVFGDRLATD
ncbi:MAG: amidohydrolase family protein [Armatimonadetes bacterium]|nr:amidohydrolase family protein [Armatimonadota bacterium]